MTPKRHSKQEIKNQRRKSVPNNKVTNNARKCSSTNFRKRKSRGQRRKSNKLIKKSPEALKGLKRSVLNEYARNLQPIPAGEVFQYMSHSNKNKIVTNQKRSLRSCAKDYVILATENFHLCRKFTTNERVDGVKSLNIKVSMQANKIDENVRRDLQSLNVHDELNTQNNNNLEVTSKSDDVNKKSDNDANLFDNPSVIEILDSPIAKDSITVKKNPPRNHIIPSGIENNDVICLDDTPLISDDSDVIFIGNKRKSVFNLGNPPKYRKTNNSVIVIDDDELPLSNSQKKKRKRRGNRLRAQRKKRVTRSSSALSQNSGHFLATSTPNKITSETQCIKCLCVGSHSCVVKPNLVTIPEEPGDKRNNNLFNPGHQNIQNSLERTRSLLEYNDFDMLGENFLSVGPIRTQGLRPIFIDGSNIAMGHSNGRFFSVKGLKICIDYFLKRRHEVTAIVPMFRKKHTQNSNPALLRRLENKGLVVFTPARTVKGRHIVPYDDRYLVLMAAVHQGIVVSSDNFNDLLAENRQMAETIERRVLNPTWMKDMIIFPVDPLGRNGPSLKEFLQFP